MAKLERKLERKYGFDLPSFEQAQEIIAEYTKENLEEPSNLELSPRREDSFHVSIKFLKEEQILIGISDDNGKKELYRFKISNQDQVPKALDHIITMRPQYSQYLSDPKLRNKFRFFS